MLSKDYQVSGDFGWWTGKLCDGETSEGPSETRVGVFPSNFVQPDIKATLETIDKRAPDPTNDPPEINFADLSFKYVRKQPMECFFDRQGYSIFAKLYAKRMKQTARMF